MKKDSVQISVQWPYLLEVLIVNFRATGRIDAHIIAFPEELQKSLTQDVLVLHCGQFFEHVDLLGPFAIVVKRLYLFNQVHVRRLSEAWQYSILAATSITTDAFGHE